MWKITLKNIMAMNENQPIARYIEGLRNEIREKLHLHPISFLFEVVSVASTIEEDEAQKQKHWVSRRNTWDKSSTQGKRHKEIDNHLTMSNLPQLQALRI